MGNEGEPPGFAAFDAFLVRLAANEDADRKARQTASRELARRRRPTTCGQCRGSGLVGGEWCEPCHASGQVAPDDDEQLVERPAKPVPCHECRGTGELGRPPFATTCRRCRGSGRRPACGSCRGAGVDDAGAPCDDCGGAGC